mmetsp:Transcript_21927/g.43843  ORF Transcript_21927/g.43843 Transcript_21927/m.43843 type:complete len:123 (-) Transcript_21927:165-533(-)
MAPSPEESSSPAAWGTMHLALTRLFFTSVCTTSTTLPRSNFSITGESLSEVSRNGSPAPKLTRYTPSGMGWVHGPGVSSAAPDPPAALANVDFRLEETLLCIEGADATDEFDGGGKSDIKIS